MATSRRTGGSLAPVTLTLWGCGIILVWWAIVLGVLGLVGWGLWAGVRLLVGG